jgi:hypothetical protein
MEHQRQETLTGRAGVAAAAAASSAAAVHNLTDRLSNVCSFGPAGQPEARRRRRRRGRRLQDSGWKNRDGPFRSSHSNLFLGLADPASGGR